eukprot:TRINITY_DN16904_c0_g1_i1.p1 TRINITY_DN16904_c0_g1~~TRINITY_DN16904_c0_g1_i1.p1  ORF type:complete len:1427 (+),score=197.84 TRINITY_DN16904_c0_g1_i1:124-4404(+)
MALVDLLQNRTKEELDELREQFFRFRSGAMTLPAFVETMTKYLDVSNVATAQMRLTHLFRSIDFDCDTRVTWEEFSTYIIEDALKAARPLPHESIKAYKCTSIIKERDAVHKMIYLRRWDKLCLLSKGNRPFTLYQARDHSYFHCLPPALFSGGSITCEYVPSHQYFVTSTADRYLRFFDAADFEIKRCMPVDTSHLVLRWHDHYGRLFSSTRDGALFGWDIGRNAHQIRPSFKWDIHSKALMDFLFIPTRQQSLVTASLDGRICTVDMEREVGSEFGSHANGVTHLSYCEQYGLLLSSGFEPHALAWISNAPKHSPYVLSDDSNPHKYSLCAVHAMERSPQILTCDVKGMVKVWDVRVLRSVHTFWIGNGDDDRLARDHPTSKVGGFCVEEHPLRLLVAEWRNVYVHEYDEGHDPTLADEAAVRIVRYNATANALVTASGKDIKVWDAQQGCLAEQFQDVGDGAEITAMCLDEYGRRLFIGTSAGTSSAHSFQTGHRIFSFRPHKAEVTALAHLAAKRLLVSASLDGDVHLSSDFNDDSSTFTLVKFNSCDILSLAVSRNLSLIVTGNMTSQCFAFDVTNPKRVVHCCETDDGEVVALSFLDQLPAFVASYASGKIRVWTTRPYQYLRAQGSSCVVWWYNSPGQQRQRWLEHRSKLVPPQPPEPPGDPVLARSNSSADVGLTLTLTPAEPGASKKDRHVSVVVASPPVNTEGKHTWNWLTSVGTAEEPAEIPRKRRQKYGNKYRPIVTAIAYHDGTHTLFTGDETGVMTAWNLCSVVKKCNLLPSMYPVKKDFSSILKAVSHKPPDPKELRDQIRVVRSWRAHTDEILSLLVLRQSQLIVSSSEDRRVVVWTFSGEVMAELSQGKSYAHGYGISPKTESDEQSDECRFAVAAERILATEQGRGKPGKTHPVLESPRSPESPFTNNLGVLDNLYQSNRRTLSPGTEHLVNRIRMSVMHQLRPCSHVTPPASPEPPQEEDSEAAEYSDSSEDNTLLRTKEPRKVSLANNEFLTVNPTATTDNESSFAESVRRRQSAVKVPRYLVASRRRSSRSGPLVGDENVTSVSAAPRTPATRERIIHSSPLSPVHLDSPARSAASSLSDHDSDYGNTIILNPLPSVLRTVRGAGRRRAKPRPVAIFASDKALQMENRLQSPEESPPPYTKPQARPRAVFSQVGTPLEAKKPELTPAKALVVLQPGVIYPCSKDPTSEEIPPTEPAGLDELPSFRDEAVLMKSEGDATVVVQPVGLEKEASHRVARPVPATVVHPPHPPRLVARSDIALAPSLTATLPSQRHTATEMRSSTDVFDPRRPPVANKPKRPTAIQALINRANKQLRATPISSSQVDVQSALRWFSGRSSAFADERWIAEMMQAAEQEIAQGAPAEILQPRPPTLRSTKSTRHGAADTDQEPRTSPLTSTGMATFTVLQ